MARYLIIFEDEGFSGFRPLTLTRPVWDLAAGILSLKDKLLRGIAAASARPEWKDFRSDGLKVGFCLRDYLAPGYPGAVTSLEEEARDEGLLSLVNGRLIWDVETAGRIDPAWEGAYVKEGSLVWANVPAAGLGSFRPGSGKGLDVGAFPGLERRPLEARLAGRPWDLLQLNAREIEADFNLLGGAGVESDLPQGVHLVAPERMRIGRSVKLSPGAVLDASAGPVNIDDEVTVMANAALCGPLHVGRGSVIKMGARIYGETSIGPVCKIGGEVAESTVLGFTNKQHDGFLGHSYLGKWINLGAGTDTSDMKNNYSTVRVGPPGGEEDTGELFAGLFMGDHSKCGIGTTFNTGSVVGVCCNIFGAGYPPKYVPSFSWGGSGRFTVHELAGAVRTVGRAMQRRNIQMGSRIEAILGRVYEITEPDRQAFLGASH